MLNFKKFSAVLLLTAILIATFMGVANAYKLQYIEGVTHYNPADWIKYLNQTNTKFAYTYGTNCISFVDRVLQDEGRGFIDSYRTDRRQLYSYGRNDGKSVTIVAQWLYDSNPTTQDIQNLFEKAHVGDVVQMYWNSSQHTAIISGFGTGPRDGKDGVWFFESNGTRNDPSGNDALDIFDDSYGDYCSINNHHHSYSDLANAYSGYFSAQEKQKDGTYKTYTFHKGFTIYNFGEVAPANPSSDPDNIFITSSNNFASSVFRSYVRKFDTDGNGYLSRAEREAVKEIDVRGRTVPSLVGIKYFPNLEWLYCNGIGLTGELDLSGLTKLVSVWCMDNQLTSLNINNCTSLPDLWAYNNKLTTLNVSGCTSLKNIHVYNNSFTALSLMHLNSLKTLNVSGCDSLTWLECYHNVNVTGISVPTITTTSLPDGYVGIPYSASLNVTAKVQPLLYYFGATAQANGLKCDADTGIITGTPKYARTFTTLATAENAGGETQKSFSATIHPKPNPKIITTSLPAGTVGEKYEANITATGLGRILITRADGELPPGLTVSKPDGIYERLLISGTPTQAGTFSIKWKARDVDYGVYLEDDYETIPIVINPKPVTITTATLPNAIAGTNYSATLSASGGTGSYTWSRVNGGTATWASVSSSGEITGTAPNVNSKTTYTINVKVSSGGAVDTKELKIYVYPKLKITANLPNAIKGVPYSGLLSVTNAVGTVKFIKNSGGTSWVNVSNSGQVTGTPTSSANFTVTVSDSIQTVTDVFYIPYYVPPAITKSSLQAGTVNTAYSDTLSATGTATIRWSRTGGTASWATVSSNGQITGTPTKADTYTLAVKAVNGAGENYAATETFNIVVNNQVIKPEITKLSLKSGTVGEAYSETLSATGTTPITWTVTGLPSNLSHSNGVIKGTPEKAGTYYVTIKVSNSAGTGGPITLPLEIKNKKLAITSPNVITAGTINKPYKYVLKAEGATPITWKLDEDSTLPNGLTLIASSGEISGTPTVSGGSYKFTVIAYNSQGESAPKEISLNINTSSEETSGILINDKNFPDDAFRKYILTYIDEDENEILSAQEIAATALIDVDYILYPKGIEYFTALEALYLNNGGFDELDVTMLPELQLLSIANGEVEKISVAGLKNLKYLKCNDNYLHTLDLTGCNQLTILDCSNNEDFSALDVSKLKELKELHIYKNSLFYIDLSSNTKITDLKIIPQAIETEIKVIEDFSNEDWPYMLDFRSFMPAEKTKNVKSDSINAGKYIKVLWKNGILYLSDYSDYIEYQYDTGLTLSGKKILMPVALINIETLSKTPPVVKPVINTSSLTNGTTGASYTTTLSATGRNITWSGNSVNGLKVNSDGTITGKPTKAGTFNITVTATNSGGSVSKTLTIVIRDVMPVIKTSSLTNGTTGANYSATLSATGQNITWSGNSVNGLKVNSNGTITGRPTKAGTYKITVTAKNSGGSVSKTLSIVIKDAKPVITTSSLTNGTLGTNYSATLSATNSGVTWSISSGKLPTGLKLTASNGKITGKPTKAGTFSFKVTAKNSAGSVSKTLKIVITKETKPVIKTSSLKAGSVGTSYTATLNATGSGVKWSVSSKLPTGLKLTASNGKITGKPTKAGTFSFKITAKNSAGSVSKTLKIVIKDVKPVIKTSSLKAGAVGTSYTATLSAKGSGVKWSVSGKLPTGLKLTASNGKITGKPTKAGTFSFKVTAKNSAGSVSKTLKIVIKDAKPVIKTSSLKAGTVGTSYTATLSAKGSGVKWSISSGKLPTGLKLTASNGKITGKPTKAGTFSFTVMAKNSAGSVKKTLKITITKAKAKTSSFADFYNSVKATILEEIENYSNDEPENEDVTPNDDNDDLTTPEEEISGETPENSDESVDQEIKNNAVNAELTLINSENVNINVDDKFYAASGTDLIFKISTWTDGDGNNIEPEKLHVYINDELDENINVSGDIFEISDISEDISVYVKASAELKSNVVVITTDYNNESDNDNDQTSGSGGCNSGFGLITLLLVGVFLKFLNTARLKIN